MKGFNIKDLNEFDIYKLMIGSIIPRPTLLVATTNSDGSLNLGPFSFINIASSNPPVLTVSVIRKDGNLKDTAKNLLREKSCVVHIVNKDNLESVNQTAANLVENESELDRAKMSLVDSKIVSTKGVKESPVRFECEYRTHVEIREWDVVKADTFFLDVKYIHIDEKLIENNRVNHELLNPVSRLAGDNYSLIGEVIELKRPE